jgi:N-acetylmuramoyl-L-alanine amidase
MIATESMQEANVFSKLAQAELAGIDRLASRGVKQAPFVVLLGVQMPASLIEIGFLSNPVEEDVLRSPRRRDAIAAALERAVLEYARRYDALRGIGRGDR